MLDLAAPSRRLWLAGAAGALGGAWSTPLAALGDEPRSGSNVVVQGAQPVVSLQTSLDTHGRPLARVRINGQGPFRFLVDTGATTSVVSAPLARRLALPAVPSRIVHTVTETVLTPFARVTSLEVGPTRSENITAALLDGPALASADGILGMDVFAGRRVRFNLTRKEVELLPADGSTRGRLPMNVPITMRNGLLVESRGQVGGVRATFVLDTGAEISMMNRPLTDALLDFSRRRRNREPATILGVSSTVLNGLWVQVPTIDAMGLKISRLSVISVDSPVFAIWRLDQVPAMILGMDVLAGLETIQIDYRRRQLQLRLLGGLMSGRTATAAG
jgi:predicted aspartyl protease